MKNIRNSIHVAFLLVVPGFLWLLPQLQAVNPAPDGCYPSFTTAEGCGALNLLTTGAANTGLGWRSLFSNSIGSFNTAVGAGTLVLNTADSNTAVGVAALLLNSTGTQNTAIGTSTLVFNQSDGNTAVGAFALENNTMGANNTASGFSALASNTEGVYNVANGYLALLNNINGAGNTANGAYALSSNTTGLGNTANGGDALENNTIGIENTAIGSGALENNTVGNFNIAVGIDAGSALTTASNVICIGAPGANVDNSCYIGNIFGATSSNGVAVLVNSNGRLGTLTSSRRFKEKIKPMDEVSEELYALKPVTFHYKKEIDPADTRQLGLVAEEVEKVNPDLIVRDKEGKPYSVRYEQVNAMLLNEFLKEHKAFLEQKRKLEELETNYAEQQREIQGLVSLVKEQATQIQRVTAQLEANKPAPRLAENDQ